MAEALTKTDKGETPPPVLPVQRSESITHRVRVGLTGLAFVFLLVMLATAFLGSRRDKTATLAQNSSEPSDPLAQLGVVPGNPPPSESVPAPAKPR